MVHTYADISKKKRQKLKVQQFQTKSILSEGKSIEMNDKAKIKESPKKLRRENEEPN